ncbi:glycoside hydrolase family 113 [Constantimarinum furrinae]|uniref:Glycoside hydrolase n=1 Tax=Constantimarinum furrinae TaxID=2562285 RepID=A0A7G8PS10_9FLAO|nr:glycoside hydrolase TIM-barrel-like domain-containing protein [Constantimarinum furrinae]QNJ97126.1 glycoside hydrolase [Constantimarinum furrinae]
MHKISLVLIVLCCSVFSACTQTTTTKINGVSYVASRDAMDRDQLDPLTAVNANYAAIMPFGFIRSVDDPKVIFDTQRQWFGETRRGVKQCIDMLHENNIKVMVKPQLWLSRGEFTGYLKLNSEEEWRVLEDSYRGFILTFAEVAQETGADMFCIGTELEQFIVSRTDFWNTLIAEVKEVYHGKLTYAANWDEYKRVPFWNQLDYIGVDAYFPVSESKTPGIEEAKAGWQPWKAEMKALSEANDLKIVFTEFGYRSVDYAGKEPWKSDRDMKEVNMEAQTNLTQALFDELWDEPWIAGGFVWKWFPDHHTVGGIENSQFTPQNKPAEKIIAQRFSTSK